MITFFQQRELWAKTLVWEALGAKFNWYLLKHKLKNAVG